MSQRTPSRPRVVCSGLLTLALLPLSHAAGSDFTGRYECAGVIEGEQAVAMTFSVSVVSHRSEEILGATLSLLDASDPAVVYAEFPALSFSAGIDVLLTASVNLDRSEWERWRSGAPPRVRLEAYGADGTDLSAMVELVQVSSPEVMQ
jgi:hypothetical protein